MDEVYKIIDAWYLKLATGVIATMLAPFKVSFFILCVMIFIDTISGSVYAAKIKKFSSRGMRKALKKVLVYYICILVVRLMEIGIASILETDILTIVMISFLIITETASVLENLTLLGAPLPGKLTNFIIEQIKSPAVKDLFSAGINKKEYIGEILEMTQFHLPNLQDDNIRKMLDIKFQEWAQFVNIIDYQFNSSLDSKEILYYRVSNLIDVTFERINEKWKHEDIPDNCINAFSIWHAPTVKRWMKDIKAVCYSDDDQEKKKTQIIEKVIILLYQTLTDVRKFECFSDEKKKT